MTKISDDIRKQIAEVKKEYEKLAAKTRKLEDKDWFLVEVKFTPESLAAYQAELKAFPEELAAWKAKPESEKPFIFDKLEPMPPFPPSAYDIGDFLGIDRSPHKIDSYFIEAAPDMSREKYAIRASQFAFLEQKPHIISITVLDQGERIAALVKEAIEKRQAERLAELSATRPAPGGNAGGAPAP